MKISIKKRSGKLIDTLVLPDDISVEEFKNLFYGKFHYYPERQWWNVGEPTGSPIRDGTLAENGLKDGSVLFFKDLGVQISWRFVFFLEYLGPLLVFPLFYYCPGLIYGVANPNRSLVQTIGFVLTMLHYLKRELETLFIHRFSNVTMPIIRVPINCGHYWVLYGVSVGYYLFHPSYMTPWRDDQKWIMYALAATMLGFEVLNFQTHLVLRNLRSRGTKERGIPYGWGFGMVSCANYTWEVASWVVFSLLVHTATAWLFTIVALLQMTQWALKKHYSYRKQFQAYPRCRKAIIPFIL